MKAIVTLVVGRQYKARFSRYCYPSWKTYADRHGFDLVVFDDLLDRSARGLSRSPAWQKCLAIRDPRVLKYEQVVWIDSDIAINAAKAPNIFEGVAPEQVGAVKDFAYPSCEQYRARLHWFYNLWEQQGVAHVRNSTPQEFMTSWGLPPTGEVAQTGVLVASPESHGSLFQKTYDVYEEKGSGSWNYEMRPLSYEIVTGSEVRWLDSRFNVVTLFAVKDEDLDVFHSAPRAAERVLRKLRLATVTLSTRQQALRRIHRDLYEHSYFLHFAGRQHDMTYL